jgi:hypothetical protein
MKKEKLHIVIVENLEYWLTNETSDWRVKEYIVRAPSRETAVKLTKEHLTVKEKTYIYSEDVWGHDMLIIAPSINKDKGVWKSVFLIITAKRKACGIKNEMRFSDGKTKCAIKKHPSNETWMLFC